MAANQARMEWAKMFNLQWAYRVKCRFDTFAQKSVLLMPHTYLRRVTANSAQVSTIDIRLLRKNNKQVLHIGLNENLLNNGLIISSVSPYKIEM